MLSYLSWMFLSSRQNQTAYGCGTLMRIDRVIRLVVSHLAEPVRADPVIGWYKLIKVLPAGQMSWLRQMLIQPTTGSQWQ